MSFQNRILLLVTTLSMVVLGTGAFAQDPAPQPVEEKAGVAFFPSESVDGVDAILDRLAGTNGEGKQTQPLEELLDPANTNSPRDTIVSFLKLTQRYYNLLRQDTYTQEDTAELQHLYNEMQWFFDLRNVAPSLRQDVAVNNAVYLREIIDRIGLPPLEDIPDREQMLAVIDEDHAPVWKIGNSPLEIARIDEGPNQGQYLFNEETLESVKDLYWQLRAFPYRTKAAEGFYEASFLTPDPTLQAWTNDLPAWSHKAFLGQTIWQWIAMVALFVLAFLAIWLFSATLKRLTRKTTPLRRDSILLLVPLFSAVLSYILYDLIGDKIFITGLVFQAAVYVIYSMALIAGIIFIFSLGTVIIDFAEATEYAREHSSDNHLIALGVRVASIVAIIAVLLQGMNLMGFSLTTIVASAGVTGLAVALAAQNTLKNVFGSLMLLLDKPFEVGQRIKIRGYDGVVEDIGMRSTRLRLLSGHLVSIPNENLAEMDIENVDMRPSIKRTLNIPLPPDTSLEKIQHAETVLQEILAVPDGKEADDKSSSEGKLHDEQASSAQHPNEAINRPGTPPRVFFDEINPESLNITVMYEYSPPDYTSYLAHAQMINHEVFRRFREEGISSLGS